MIVPDMSPGAAVQFYQQPQHEDVCTYSNKAICSSTLPYFCCNTRLKVCFAQVAETFTNLSSMSKYTPMGCGLVLFQEQTSVSKVSMNSLYIIIIYIIQCLESSFRKNFIVKERQVSRVLSICTLHTHVKRKPMELNCPR